MTDFVIQDGTGTGRVARVSERNELDVLATTQTEEHRVSIVRGKSFYLGVTETANSLTLADGNTYNILYMKNTSASDDLVIEKVLSSSDTAGINMQWVRNPTLGSVSANTAATPANTNFGSSNTATGTFHIWDESGTTGIGGLSGGTTFMSHITGVGKTVYPIDGAIIMPPGTSFLIKATNGTGGNVEWETGVRFYYQAEQT